MGTRYIPSSQILGRTGCTVAALYLQESHHDQQCGEEAVGLDGWTTEELFQHSICRTEAMIGWLNDTGTNSHTKGITLFWILQHHIHTGINDKATVARYSPIVSRTAVLVSGSSLYKEAIFRRTSAASRGSDTSIWCESRRLLASYNIHCLQTTIFYLIYFKLPPVASGSSSSLQTEEAPQRRGSWGKTWSLPVGEQSHNQRWSMKW